MDFLEKRAEIKKLMLQLEVLTKGAQERAHQEVGEVVAPEVLQDGLQEVVQEGLQKVVQGGIQEVLEEGLQEGRQEEVQEQEQQRREMEIQEEVAAVDESLDISENHDQIEIIFVKSKGNRNLGKIISGKQQFICNRRVKGKAEDGGSTYYYDCARKHDGKGQGPGSSCKAKAIIKTNDIGEDLEVVKIAKLTDHNHICDMGRVLKWLLYEEIEKKILSDLMQKPSEVRKKVVAQFREKYRNQPDIWDQLEVLLTEDPNIDRHLNALRHKTLGNLPKSRDAIKVDQILKLLQEEGGQNIKLLDSNEMWKDA